jgi:hypothetical protein
LSLQFQSTGRPPQRDYPTYRDSPARHRFGGTAVELPRL